MFMSRVCVLQNLLSLSPNQRKDMVQKEMGTLDRRPPATLKDYAINYFRCWGSA